MSGFLRMQALVVFILFFAHHFFQQHYKQDAWQLPKVKIFSSNV